MAELESEIGIHSTYYTLLSTDLYNIFSENNVKALKNIIRLGHDIGLHFDEQKYSGLGISELQKEIIKEANILRCATGSAVYSVSMHKPSKTMLESNIHIEGLINSYSTKFFKEYKYVSDSRMNWREDIIDIITSGNHSKLHILTHPYWYSETKENLKDKLIKLIADASKIRSRDLKETYEEVGELGAQ